MDSKYFNDVLDEWIDSSASDTELVFKFINAVESRLDERHQDTARKVVRKNISRVVHEYVKERYGKDVDNNLPLGVYYDIITKLLDLLELELDKAVNQLDTTYNSRPSRCVTDDAADKILADFVNKL